MNNKNILSYIENIWDSDIHREEITNKYSTSPVAEDLLDANIINNTETIFNRLLFHDDNVELAKCNYALFVIDNIGYISDIKVNDKIQNNKIGTKIRQYAIDQLEPKVSKIYSYPTNEHIKYINRKQGFNPVDNTNLSSKWFVKY